MALETNGEIGPRRRRPQMRFSLAALLIVTTVCAIALVIGKALFYEPPTHRIAAYEKAPGTLRDWFDVGPNRVRMRLVTRNGRDGSLKFENGRGVAVQNLTAQNAPILSSAAPWLDVVQIELEPTPDRVDVIEARVFDHKTRTLLNATDPAFGWRMASPDMLQIYGLGKRLPEKLDVWFRLHGYPAGDNVKTIGPTIGSTCSFSDNPQIKLSDMRSEMRGGWSDATGFRSPASGEDDGRISAEFSFDWRSYDGPTLQIVAVLKSGERVHGEGYPEFIARSQAPLRMLLTFDADLAELDHFEVRPYGGRERFFFDAVTIPKVADRPFAQPPTATVDIRGAEVDEQITAFEPIKVRVETRRGNVARGSVGGPRRGQIVRRTQGTDPARAFTFICTVDGLRLPLEGTFRKKQSSSTLSSSSGTGSRSEASGGNIRASSSNFWVPLDQIDTVEVKFKP